MLKRRHLWALAVAALFVAWFVLLRPGFLLRGPVDYVIVSGVSMEPTLYTGDLAVVQRQEEYAIGDVVAFHVEEGIVIHRVVGGDAIDGYITQGDNRQEPDPWRPTPGEILGRMWLHAPRAGEWLLFFLDPTRFGVLVGVLAVVGGGSHETARRRRKGRGRMHSHEANGNGGGGAAPGGLGQWWPGSRAALAWLAVSVVLAAAFLTISVAAFRGTAERTERVEQLAYEHRGTFEYAVETQPSRLYPEGRIEPVVLEDGSITLPQPIYTQLARTMTVDFAYDLASDLPPDVSGELGIDLVIRAGDGWRQTETLLAPRPFEGDAAIGSVTLDFAAIGALVESIETETGFAPATYTLSVQPRVSVYGTLGSNPIEETYAPTFELLYGDTQITPPETLATAEPVSLGDDVQRANEMTLLGLGLTVRSWRWIGAAGSLLALSVAGGIAAFALLGLGRDEEARIQARYRSMLVPVESNGSHASDRSIHVHSMRHLARLAQRDGGIIFHEAGPYLHRYFVRDGEDTYDYTIRSGESGPYGPHARAVHGRADEPHGALGAAARDQ